MRSNRLGLVAGLLTLMLVSVPALAGGVSVTPTEPAQAEAHNTLDWPLGDLYSYRLDTGNLANNTNEEQVVYTSTISMDSAIWMRLYFGSVELGAGSFIRVTSLYDSEVQELNSARVQMWSNSTAYFNGDAVLFEVVAAPNTQWNRVVVEQVGAYLVPYAQRGPCADDDCGICGDSRVPSNELWSGRLMPVGCSATVYNTDSCVVSAGHCAGGGLVMQFNTPSSLSNCYPQSPGTNDQFPITSQDYVNGGVGNDWSVMLTGTNGLGEKPYDRYGVYMPLKPTFANPSDPAEVWGYGVDNGDPTRSQDQQYSAGAISQRYSSYYSVSIDITYGNSGSGLISNGELIGVVTHCSFSCQNIATRHDLAAFATARANLCQFAPPDTTPPSPNPMTFSTAPYAVSESSISMIATTATDDTPPIAYQFDFVSGGAGGTDSAWGGQIYSDTGLDTNTLYTYRCRARDGADPNNITDYSANASAATLAVVPGAPVLSNATSNSMDLNTDEGANPAYTELAVQCTYTNPTDANWDDQWVSAGGTPTGAEVWQADAGWGTLTLTGMQPGTEYRFKIKARNLDGLETALGTSGYLSTTTAGYAIGDLNCDGDVNLFDIDPFVLVITSTPPSYPEYYAQYPGCDAMLADTNGDTNVNLFDIDPFVILLTGK